MTKLLQILTGPPGAPSISSGEDTMICSSSPGPPTQKRSRAAIAADLEPPSPSKVRKLELSNPVKYASMGTGRLGPPQLRPRRYSSQGPVGPEVNPNQPSRRASTASQGGMMPTTASGFVRTHKFERRNHHSSLKLRRAHRPARDASLARGGQPPPFQRSPAGKGML